MATAVAVIVVMQSVTPATCRGWQCVGINVQPMPIAKATVFLKRSQIAVSCIGNQRNRRIKITTGNISALKSLLTLTLRYHYAGFQYRNVTNMLRLRYLMATAVVVQMVTQSVTPGTCRV